jgi:hypothetical protein
LSDNEVYEIRAVVLLVQLGFTLGQLYGAGMPGYEILQQVAKAVDVLEAAAAKDEGETH